MNLFLPHIAFKIFNLWRNQMLCVAEILCLTVISANAVLIDFEDIQTNGWGMGGQTVVNDQYKGLGVTFNSPVAIDYSKGIAREGFAHSPTRAIETCYSKEFCRTPVEMTFETPVNYLKLWVGHYGSIQKTVELLAFDDRGNIVGRDSNVMVPIDSIVPISIPLEISKQENQIYRAQVSTMPNENGQVDNGGLAVDDVDFDSNLKPEVRLASSKEFPLKAGKAVTFTAQASDSEGDVLDFQFVLDDHIVSHDPRDNTWTWTPDQGDEGYHYLTARVTDARHSSYDSLEFEVIPNYAPLIVSFQADPQSPAPKAPVTFTLQAVDPEGDPLEYAFFLDQRPIRDWSNDNVFVMTPNDNDIGDHVIQAMVRESGEFNDFISVDMPFTISQTEEQLTKTVLAEERPERSPPPPPSDPRPWLLGGAIGAVIIGHYVWKKVVDNKNRSSAKPHVKPSYKAHGDPGEARVDPEGALDVLAEIGLRAVADQGVQQLDDEGLRVETEEVER